MPSLWSGLRRGARCPGCATDLLTNAELMKQERTREILQRVDAEGIGFIDYVSPVLLGNDGRVWDGHHRICIAIERGIPSLMCEMTS